MTSKSSDLLKLLHRRASGRELSSDELSKLETNVNNLLEALKIYEFDVFAEPSVIFAPKKNID